MKIEDVNINDKFLGAKRFGSEENKYADSLITIVDKTSNSIEIEMKAKTAEGINCSQWMTFNDFSKRFNRVVE